MRLLDDAELEELGRDPVGRVRDALAAGDADRAADLSRHAERGWVRSVEGFQTWIVHTLAFLTEHHGPGAPGAALGALTTAMCDRSPWPADPTSLTEPEPHDSTGAIDDAASPHLAELLRTEQRLRLEHDAWLDAVCLVLSHVYRTHGIDTLEAAIRFAGDRTLLAWMPRDVERPPDLRVRTWVAMLQGNFATVRVSEDDEKFTITQDPCGSCGRQVAACGYPGPLDLAVVEEAHPITFGRGGIPVYRTHVAVMHFLMPEERVGVPWPVVACPAGCGSGPCRILLYKDPFDPAARDAATELRGAGRA